MFGDITLTIIMLALFVFGTVGIAWLLAGKRKKIDPRRYVALGAVSVVSLLVGWWAAQFFLPASVVTGALLALAGFKWVIGLSWKRALIGAGAWIVLWFMLNFIVVLIVSMSGFGP